MSENPYKPALITATPSVNARRALAFWLVAMGCWMLSLLALTVYGLCAFSFDTPMAIDGIFPLLYAIGSFWIAFRVRHGQGIKAARFLLFAMIPFVAGELATPIFVIVKGIGISSPLMIILFVPMFAHIYTYANIWRWLTRLGREVASNPAARSPD
jgi:hypothetical protein